MYAPVKHVAGLFLVVFESTRSDVMLKVIKVIVCFGFCPSCCSMGKVYIIVIIVFLFLV